VYFVSVGHIIQLLLQFSCGWNKLSPSFSGDHHNSVFPLKEKDRWGIFMRFVSRMSHWMLMDFMLVRKNNTPVLEVIKRDRFYMFTSISNYIIWLDNTTFLVKQTASQKSESKQAIMWNHATTKHVHLIISTGLSAVIHKCSHHW
jgi:alkyl sulfatase BDS1-like metallo-beta-lactamase superfamily hydrolase